MDESHALLGTASSSPSRFARCARRVHPRRSSSSSPPPSRRMSCDSCGRFSTTRFAWCKAGAASTRAWPPRAVGGLQRRRRRGRPERILPQIPRARTAPGRRGGEGRGGGEAHAPLLQQDRDVSKGGKYPQASGQGRREAQAGAVPRRALARAPPRVLDAFLVPPKKGDVPLILVCTDRASRGLDASAVKHVILFDFPRIRRSTSGAWDEPREARSGRGGFPCSCWADRCVWREKSCEETRGGRSGGEHAAVFEGGRGARRDAV